MSTTHDIAVIGGGGAGIGAAHTLLTHGRDVVMVDPAPSLGGNCFGVFVHDTNGHPLTTDAGVSDFNRTTFTHFARIVDELGLPTHPIGAAASFASIDGRTIASSRGGHWRIDPSATETQALALALARFPRQRARVVVHHDTRLVGHDRDTWGAFHYVVPTPRLPRTRPTITFFPKRLARLPETAPDVFVTMNPHREPRPELVVVDRFFLHPVATESHASAVAQLDGAQGHRRTWYAGSYLQSPFVHECALTSGKRAAKLLLGSAVGRQVFAALGPCDALLRRRA